MGEQTVTLTFNTQIPVGEYSDIIYLTDEDGLSEPLHIEYAVEAIPPYDGVDEGKYALNMSICAQVVINEPYGEADRSKRKEMVNGQMVNVIDTDERDIVYAIYRNECVGQANVTFNAISNTTDVYLTVLGNDEMNRKQIHFQLWQASTGKVYDLTANRNVLFSHGFVYGCGENEPLILTTGGSERQQIELSAGWNWVSTHLDLSTFNFQLSTCMSAAKPWTEGDLIKNPNTRQFSTYDAANDSFVGTLDQLHYSQLYMIYAANGNTMRISGEMLPEDSMKIKVRGDGQWSPMPCLFDQRVSVTEALADYYQRASVGDMIKAHNRFATFSADKRWVGDLTALQPGEGYLFRRLKPGSVEIAFYKPEASNNIKRRQTMSNGEAGLFTNPQAATNMTMIACVKELKNEGVKELKVYVGNELAAVASPIINHPYLQIVPQGKESSIINDEVLYFLTIQSDKVGELRFELNGEIVEPVDISTSRHLDISYSPNAHHGSLADPIILKPVDDSAVYKILENDHVVIIRNGERYDVTGKKL